MCMCIYSCVHVSVYPCVRIYAYLYSSICIYRCIYMYVCVGGHALVCGYLSGISFFTLEQCVSVSLSDRGAESIEMYKHIHICIYMDLPSVAVEDVCLSCLSCLSSEALDISYGLQSRLAAEGLFLFSARWFSSSLRQFIGRRKESFCFRSDRQCILLRACVLLPEVSRSVGLCLSFPLSFRGLKDGRLVLPIEKTLRKRRAATAAYISCMHLLSCQWWVGVTVLRTSESTPEA